MSSTPTSIFTLSLHDALPILEIDEIQANAILSMQLRRLAALERQKIIEEHDRLQALIEEYTAILADPARQREIVSEELGEIVDKRSEEHTSELQSRGHLVCRLLLEKKKRIPDG